MTARPFYVAGRWRTGRGSLSVKSPYDGSVVAELGVPTDEDVEDAVAAAVETFKASRHSISRSTSWRTRWHRPSPSERRS